MNTEPIFIEQRRQPFITEAYYEAALKSVSLGVDIYTEALKNGYMDVEGQRIPQTKQGKEACLEALANEYLNHLILGYTAGEPIEKLREEMDGMVAAWEDVAKEARVIASPPKGSCFGFGWRTDYQKFIGMVGLAVLLHREDLLPRIDTLVPGFKEADAVYEELIKPFITGRKYADGWYHDLPYEDAINALDSPDPKEQTALMKRAVESWYAAHEGVPFHDSHKNISDDGGGGYVGYWCFELAALSYLHRIDDTSFKDTVTYPKDLVDWARKYQEPAPAAPVAPVPMQVITAQPGQAVPRGGVWQTTAMLEPRSIKLNAGDTLPATLHDKSGNAVVWFLRME